MQSIIRLTLKIKTDATVIFQKCFPMIFFFFGIQSYTSEQCSLLSYKGRIIFNDSDL